jgi:hypothetical protein
MQIQDFNRPGAPRETVAGHEAGVAGEDAAASPDDVGADDRASVEIALLKAQVEHLELVVETARSLMTSNQERLLRRLHDLPREMAALAARLDRFDHPGRGGPATERTRSSIRRVA